MTKLWLEHLQAAFSHYLEQFGDDPGTSRIGCCENGGQAHDTDKASAAAISEQTVKRPRPMRMKFMLSVLIEKNVVCILTICHLNAQL